MMEKYKLLFVNAALAFSYSFLTAFTLTGDDDLSKAFFVSAALAGLRIAAGVVAAGIDRPIPMDTPPAGGPDPTE